MKSVLSEVKSVLTTVKTVLTTVKYVLNVFNLTVARFAGFRDFQTM